MRSTQRTWRIGPISASIVGGVLLFVPSPSRAAPVHAWHERQVGIEPYVPPPQGRLEVYSESYVMYDADVPHTNRRPVEVYSVDGQLVASADHPFGDGPLCFDLTPGHYVIVSESHMQGRRVQADVQDGHTTIVSESSLEHAPVVSLAG